jgi:hypothetical protein
LVLAAVIASSQDIDPRDFAGERWYGLYLNGEKVGFSHSTTAVNDDGSVRTTEEAQFKLRMAGHKQDMRVFTARDYGADGVLRRILEEVDDASGRSAFEVVVEGDQMRIRSSVGGQSRQETRPSVRETLEDAFKFATLLRGADPVGRSVRHEMFEPMYGTTMSGVSTVKRVDERVLDGVTERVFTVHTLLEPMGVESTARVLESGEILEDRIAGGIITMRLEPEAVAKDVHYTNDTIVANAVLLKEPIGNPRLRDALALTIRGPLTEEHALDTGRQTIVIEDDGSFSFSARRREPDELTRRTMPFGAEAPFEWCEATAYVQSDHPRLKAKAREIIGDEADGFAAVAHLSDWVHDHVESTFSARLTNALEVLDNMEGDCTEHSLLFVGLARAAGIPAREVAGLIYVDRPEPGFYFHQWARAWVGEWIEVDPTFNQPLADVTHIALIEGDLLEQVRLLPVIGRLEISVDAP